MYNSEAIWLRSSTFSLAEILADAYWNIANRCVTIQTNNGSREVSNTFSECIPYPRNAKASLLIEKQPNSTCFNVKSGQYQSMESNSISI